MNKQTTMTALLRLKKTLLPAIILACLAAMSGATQAHSAFPAPRGAVNDFAGVLSPDTAARMEALAAEILQKTGTAVVVGTFKTLDGDDPDQFANELYEFWGIGKKGEDKGVLIMLAVQERRVRIETGFGVEGALPDGLVGSILDRYVVPLLKQNRFEEGLFNAMAATGQVLAKDAGTEITGMQAAPAQRRSSGRRASPLALLPFLIIFVIMMCTRSGRRMLPLLLLMSLSGGRGGGGFGGGGFSGGFGGFGGGMSGGGGAGRGF
jgi:uncharacterized protein